MTLTYNPSIPQPNDIPAQSQSQMLANFSLINSEFAVNHSPMTAVDQQGYHTKLYFHTGLIGDPALTAPESSFYPKLVAGVAQLFFQNGILPANAVQLTKLPITSVQNSGDAAGTIYTIDTPWGLRIYFGTTGQLVSSGPKVVRFPTAFSIIYVGMCTPNDPNAVFIGTEKTVAQLSIRASGLLNQGADFIAVGVL